MRTLDDLEDGELPDEPAPALTRTVAPTQPRIELRLAFLTLPPPEEQGAFARLVDRALGRPPKGPRVRTAHVAALPDAPPSAPPELPMPPPRSLRERVSARPKYDALPADIADAVPNRAA